MNAGRYSLADIALADIAPDESKSADASESDLAKRLTRIYEEAFWREARAVSLAAMRRVLFPPVESRRVH